MNKRVLVELAYGCPDVRSRHRCYETAPLRAEKDIGDGTIAREVARAGPAKCLLAGRLNPVQRSSDLLYSWLGGA